MNKTISRNIEPELKSLADSYPVITITGPRQSGKTTLVKNIFPSLPYFNLEDPDVRQLANTDPRSFLKQSNNGMILDEIQRVPDLASYIQGIVDHSKKKQLFILTGSQQFEVIGSITQSLAGRTALLKLLPCTINEVKKFNYNHSVDEYLLYGFYPRIYDRKLEPTRAYRNYFETYIERDLRQLIEIKNLHQFEKFIRLCAGRTGQIFSANNLANEVGVSVPTIQSWISILEASYIIFFLQPFYKNIGKRLIKSPKLYFYDVGLATYLLGIENITQISRDPLRGALFENLVINELVKERYNRGLDNNLFFYRDSNKNEIDILFKSGTKLIPVEIKSSETFNKDFLKTFRYIRKVLTENIDNGFLIYGGDIEQRIENVQLLHFEKCSGIFS